MTPAEEIEAWKNVAFSPTARSMPATKILRPANWLSKEKHLLIISREPASDTFPGPNMHNIDMLIVSMSLPNERPSHAQLLTHMTSLLGETYAAASVEHNVRSIRGNSIYRTVFLAPDNMPVFAEVVSRDCEGESALG